METNARPHNDNGPIAAENAGVDAFFTTLCYEQARFLDAFGQARSLLGSQSRQLALLTAIQGRLTRQFFDAQRGIMMRRAEVDAEVAFIAAVADENALALVDSARGQVAAGFIPASPDRRVYAPVSGLVPVIASDGELCDQQQIAALGVSVVRTMEEADALASVIDEAFESREPDGAAAARDLADILDEWWAFENQEGRAVVDDAHARAAVRRHIASIEANEIFEAARADALSSAETLSPGDAVREPTVDVTMTAHPPRQLPRRMVNLTDQADSSNLAALLAELAASLEVDPPIIPAEPFATAPTIEPVRPPIELRLPAATTDDPFRRFWEQGPFPNASSAWRHRGGISVQVVVPVSAVTSVAVLLLAWIR